MDYYHLLKLCTELGYNLAISGAETFRIEDTITRIMASYDIECQVFAIPNNLIVSIEAANGKPMTLMRRIGFHGNNLHAVEQYNALSRQICAKHPEPNEAIQWLHETKKSLVDYSLIVQLLGNMIGAAGFAVFFGGSLIDFICAAFCGLLVGTVNRAMNKLKVNPFFSTMLLSFVVALSAYTMGAFHIAPNADSVIIGTFMILLPGLVFTNALRDIIYGDTNSGINRIMQVLLIAAAVALGTGIGWQITKNLWGTIVSASNIIYPLWAQCITAALGCIGFTILFNIHGKGSILCILGGGFTWAVYGITVLLSSNDIAGYFVAALFAAAYAETMARIRKCPAISYLIISIFPLIPGAGIYYTTNRLVTGDMSRFASIGTHTIAIAGAIAVGILMISTIFRLWSIWTQHNKST